MQGALGYVTAVVFIHIIMNASDYYKLISMINFSAVKTYLNLGLEERFRFFPFAPVRWFGKWGPFVWDWYCQVFVGETISGLVSNTGAGLGPPPPPRGSGLFPAHPHAGCRSASWPSARALRTLGDPRGRQEGTRAEGLMSCFVSCRSEATLHRSWRKTSHSSRPK